MRFKKNASDGDNSVQNRFSAYLVIALRHAKYKIIAERIRYQKFESTVAMTYLLDSERTQRLSNTENLSCIEQIEFQNDRLEKTIESLSEKERFVLFNRAIAERRFDEIAGDLNLSYKGVAAIYYRAMQKIRKDMGDGQ